MLPSLFPPLSCVYLMLPTLFPPLSCVYLMLPSHFPPLSCVSLMLPCTCLSLILSGLADSPLPASMLLPLSPYSATSSTRPTTERSQSLRTSTPTNHSPLRYWLPQNPPILSPVKFGTVVPYSICLVHFHDHPGRLSDARSVFLNSVQVYGETSFELVCEVMKLTKMTENDVFVDLGSGELWGNPYLSAQLVYAANYYRPRTHP